MIRFILLELRIFPILKLLGCLYLCLLKFLLLHSVLFKFDLLPFLIHWRRLFGAWHVFLINCSEILLTSWLQILKHSQKLHGLGRWNTPWFWATGPLASQISVWFLSYFKFIDLLFCLSYSICISLSSLVLCHVLNFRGWWKILPFICLDYLFCISMLIWLSCLLQLSLQIKLLKIDGHFL